MYVPRITSINNFFNSQLYQILIASHIYGDEFLKFEMWVPFVMKFNFWKKKRENESLHFLGYITIQCSIVHSNTHTHYGFSSQLGQVLNNKKSKQEAMLCENCCNHQNLVQVDYIQITIVGCKCNPPLDIDSFFEKKELANVRLIGLGSWHGSLIFCLVRKLVELEFVKHDIELCKVC